LVMTSLQALRKYREAWFSHLPDSRAFSSSMGALSGVSSMIANAAAPVTTLYLLSMRLPRWEFVGTSAWFYLVVNLVKSPFSARQGLITVDSLRHDLYLVPAVFLGLWLGRYFLEKISQQLFESLMLILAALSALRLLLT